MLGVLLIKFFINKSCFWYFRWFVVIQFIMHVSAFVVVRQWRNYAGLLLSNYITFCSVFECNIIRVQSNYFSSECNQYHNLFFCNSNSRVIIFFQLSPFFLKMIILTTKRIEMHSADCSSKGTWRLELFSV